MSSEKFKQVTYNNKLDQEFRKEVTRRVNDYIRKNKIKKNHSMRNLSITILLILLQLFVYLQLVLFEHSSLMTSILLFLFAVVSVPLLANFGHELGHNGMTRFKKLNRALFVYIFEFSGVDSYLWRHTHNLIHHPMPNIPDYDCDIKGNKVMKMGPHEKHYPNHRYLHIYAPFLYTLFFLNKFFAKDFNTFKRVTASFENSQSRVDRLYRNMLLRKGLYLFLMLGVPTLFLSYSFFQIAGVFVVYHMTTSVILGFTLGGAHSSLTNKFRYADSKGDLNSSYFRHQIETTVDFHATSRFWGLVWGGINAHAAHHLYPGASSEIYPYVSKVLEELCPKYGINYVNVSLTRMYINHWKYLRELAKDSSRVRATLMPAEGATL